MKYTLTHKTNVTMLSLLLGLAISVAPTFAHETSETFKHDSTWGQLDRLVWDYAPDSEYSTEEIPLTVRTFEVDLATELEGDEPDSEYSTEELPLTFSEFEADPATELEWDEPDSEY